MIENDMMTLAALVAAFVGIVKGFGLPSNYSPIVALATAALFVLLPADIRQEAITISVVGLTAAGAYSFTKNRPPLGSSKDNADQRENSKEENV